MKPFIKFQTIKGFRDFLPEETLKRIWLEGKIRQVFEQWGFDPLETPTLESMELFSGQIGEDEKLFYQFEDRGGRKVALRYDQTVPACRVVGQYSYKLPMPFRRYQIQPVFRAEKPQKGRYREFLHADADIFGVRSVLADSQMIALSLDIYQQLGFKDYKVLINNRDMFKDIPYKAITSIDKIKKIGKEGVLKEMEKKDIPLGKAKQYLDFVTSLKPNEKIKTILKYLKKSGFNENNYCFDPTISRSFAYSNGPVWEVVIKGFEAGSVLGGERYDKIIKSLFGLDIPGTGFAIGFDRTLEAANQFGLIPQRKTLTSVLVTVFGEENLDYSLQIAFKLRKEKINTEIYPDAEVKLEKQFKYADKKGLPYAIIIGPNEVKINKITVKNMKTGKQETVSFKELVKKLKANG